MLFLAMLDTKIAFRVGVTDASYLYCIVVELLIRYLQPAGC